MSLLKIYYIWCNGCRRTHGNGERTAEKARALARADGWRRIPGSTSVGSDICPRCAPNYPEAR